MANGTGISNDPANMKQSLPYKQIAQLASLKPDVAARIAKAGMALARNGVMGDGMQISAVFLGSISPYMYGASQSSRGADQGRGF